MEFSFLLGVATLGAATCYDAYKHHEVMLEQYTLSVMVIGFVAAFICAVIAVKWMVAYLNSHGLGIFGWYRIGLGAFVGGWLLVVG